jgi:hypothetical protein
MPESLRDILRRRLRAYSNPNAPPYDPAKHPDRRDVRNDRRQCHTFLANDRRSGIADRRTRLPSIPDLGAWIKRKKQDQWSKE